MKRIIYALALIIGVISLSGCTKNYKAITYTKFLETFNNKQNYITDNQSIRYESKFERLIQATGNKTQFLFYEFKTEEDARNYMIDNYKKRANYKFKDKKSYITVKYKKEMYFYAIQVDKMVITGTTSDVKNKSEVNKLFKELGY